MTNILSEKQLIQLGKNNLPLPHEVDIRLAEFFKDYDMESNSDIQTRIEFHNFVAREIALAVKEGEIALARKVLAVARNNNPMRPRGMTMKKRLELLTEKMGEIIPDPFTIETEALSQGETL